MVKEVILILACINKHLEPANNLKEIIELIHLVKNTKEAIIGIHRKMSVNIQLRKKKEMVANNCCPDNKLRIKGKFYLFLILTHLSLK